MEFTAHINVTSTLLEKVWTTLMDYGLGGLLKPWQMRRVRSAKVEMRAEEIVTIAQAERHAEDILSCRKSRLADGTLVETLPAGNREEVLTALEAPQRAVSMRRSLNLIKPESGLRTT